MCLFDVAATGNLNIGGATKDIGKELEIITELLKPSMILNVHIYMCMIPLQLFVILPVFMEHVSVTILAIVLMVIQEIYVIMQVYRSIYVVYIYLQCLSDW